MVHSFEIMCALSTSESPINSDITLLQLLLKLLSDWLFPYTIWIAAGLFEGKNIDEPIVCCRVNRIDYAVDCAKIKDKTDMVRSISIEEVQQAGLWPNSTSNIASSKNFDKAVPPPNQVHNSHSDDVCCFFHHSPSNQINRQVYIGFNIWLSRHWITIKLEFFRFNSFFTLDKALSPLPSYISQI